MPSQLVYRTLRPGDIMIAQGRSSDFFLQLAIRDQLSATRSSRFPARSLSVASAVGQNDADAATNGSITDSGDGLRPR